MMYIIIGIACLVGIIVVVLLLPNSGKQRKHSINSPFHSKNVILLL